MDKRGRSVLFIMGDHLSSSSGGDVSAPNQPQADQVEVPAGMKQCPVCGKIVAKSAPMCPYCGAKLKKSSCLTIGCAVLAAGIVLLIVIVAMVSGGGSSDGDKAKGGRPGASPVAESADESESSAAYDKFVSLKFGSTYKEAAALFGKEGELSTETAVGDTSAEHYAINFGFMESVSLQYMDGKLTTKAQIGLKSGKRLKITKALFAQVKSGMSYQEVCQLLGGEGVLTSANKLGIGGQDLLTEDYNWDTEELGSLVSVVFQNDKVFSKTQNGLK